MATTRVLTVVGTRPEAIKLAPVVRELERRPDTFESVVCATAQHRDLLDRTLAVLGREVDHDLDIMRAGQTPAETATRALEGLDRMMDRIDPHMVLVQGDTATAFAGALAAFYQGVPVGHVEAGLRTGDRRAPFPEEMNRRLITQLADLHFAPTASARDALLREGVPDDRVVVTGNTGIDALLWMRDRVRDAIPAGVPDWLRDLPADRPVLLVTGHRRESFAGGLDAVCRAVRAVADAEPELVVVFPVHPNPAVREAADVLRGHGRIHLIEPLGYPPFVWLLDRATVVVSDSGGLQEEAPALGTPLLVTREKTERPEAVEVGSARLVGHDRKRLEAELLRLLREPEARAPMEVPRYPFGDGTAAVQVVDAVERWTGVMGEPRPPRSPHGGALLSSR